MSKLDTLIEQTSFLIAKQNEAVQDCLTLFADLLATVDKRIKLVDAKAPEAESLTEVRELLAEQAEQIKEGSQEDIDFLAEQLKTLQQIKTVNDPAKAQELLKMLLDDDVEIKDTAVFKKEVTEESAISRQNLVVMLNDIKDAIQEGNAQDVAVYLESILNDADGEDEDGDDDDDTCEDECCGKQCGGAKKAKGKGSCGGCDTDCCGKGEVDIFESMSLYEEDAPKKAPAKNKKK
jgi:hypothetical protein